MPKGGLDPNKSFVAITGGDHCGGNSCTSIQKQADVKAWLHQAVELAKKQEGDKKVVVFGFTNNGMQANSAEFQQFIQNLFTEFANENIVSVFITWESGNTIYFACVSAACKDLNDEQKKKIACAHATGTPDCAGKKVVEVKQGQTISTSSEIALSDGIDVWLPSPSCKPVALKTEFGC